jgi:heterodisulfide reductase subunit C
MIFDEVFSEQVFETGKIEDGRVILRFFKRTGQALRQPWMEDMVKGMLRHLPIGLLTRMGLATLVAPRTKNWGDARAAIEEYVAEREAHNRKALGLDELVQSARSEI